MGTMLDAAEPANIPPDLDGTPALRITVLASEAGECFDVEPGNAGAAPAADAMVARYRRGEWSVLYVNQADFAVALGELRKRGVGLATAASWPAPGVYLWAADPSGNIASGAWRPGVAPLAVQTTDSGTVDTSTTAPNFPARVAGYIDGARYTWPPAAWDRFTRIGQTPGPAPAPAPSPPPAPPAPPIPEDCTVQLLVLKEGSQGPQVRAAQTLMGGVTVDGVFGPVTHARVVEFQTAHHLTADGVIGAHTWGGLLGAPQ